MFVTLRLACQRLLALFRSRALDDDLRNEMAAHLAFAAEDFARQGHSPAEARRLAALKFGGVDAARERHRDARGLPLLDSLRQDLLFALRGFRREPGFTFVAVLILALGIGANTAVFSVVNPLLLRPLPFPDGDRLVWIAPDGPSDGDLSQRSYIVDFYDALRRTNQSFASLTTYDAFFGFEHYTLTGRGEPEGLVGVETGPQFFDTLGVQPAAGRLFTREEQTPNGPRAILLGHTLWLRRFAADPAIVGQTVSLNDQPTTIVGVLPASFDFSGTFTPGVQVDFFRPANLDALRQDGATLALFARLKPDVSVERADAEIREITARLKAERRDWSFLSARVTPLKTHVSGRMQRALAVLWGAVGLVLLIVCANLSHLLLARTAARRKEIAVRFALGAGRGRVVRQLLTEGLVLALAGAAAGIPLAYALTAAVKANALLSVPLLHQVQVDTAALAFTAGVATIAGLLFGLLPALRLAGRDPHAALKEQTRGSTDGPGAAWLRSALVVAEIALACVLLVGAGLLLRSFDQLLQVDLGFQPARVFAMRIDAGARPGRTPEQRQALLVEAVRRVRALPGVEAAGTTDALPLDRNRSWGLGVPGERYGDFDMLPAFVYITGPGYFQAMGIPIQNGRDFGDSDRADGPSSVIISRSLAQRLFGDRDPIGRSLNSGNPKDPYTVVGVAGNVRQTSVDEGVVWQMYVAQAQKTERAGEADLIIRSTLPPASLVSSVRGTLGALDASFTSTDFRPVEDLVARAVSPRRFIVTLLGGFSLLALLLACLGIYGVVSYGVSQRVPEIGVRLALGATAGTVGRQVMRDTVRLAVIGITIGLGCALIAARLIASLLYSTSPADLPTFAGTAAVLIGVALVAGAAPALRAARVDPISALRAD